MTQQYKKIIQNQDIMIENLEEEKQVHWHELKEERTRVEILAEEMEKYSSVQTIIWEKGTSVLHCKDCKETETHFEYCIPSTVSCYKILYEMAQLKNVEKQRELDEYNILFEELQKQDTQRNEERQEAFEAILINLDEVVNPEYMYAEELT